MKSGTLTETEKKVSNLLLELGIGPNLVGYAFLKDCIMKGAEYPKLLSKVSKELYPIIAEFYETTPEKLERSMRNAIEVGYNSDKLKNLNEMFGINFFERYQKPSCAMFIAFIADRLKFM